MKMSAGMFDIESILNLPKKYIIIVFVKELSTSITVLKRVHL